MQRISNRIYFTETTDKFTLIISNGLSVILKYFFLIMIPCVLIGTGFVFVSIVTLNDIGINFVKFLGGIIAAFAGIVYLNKEFQKEIIEVSKTTLSIQNKTLFGNRIKTYLVSDIAHFKCVVKNAFEKHVLEGNKFDYLGVTANEIKLEDVIKNGTLEFFCKGERIRFGMNVLSWEAEEIVSRIEKFTGNNLQIDDSMEKLLDDLNNDENQTED